MARKSRWWGFSHDPGSRRSIEEGASRDKTRGTGGNHGTARYRLRWRWRAAEVLDFAGIQGREVFAKNLSYGDQRRLEIARALASQPKRLLLDEPSMGLAPVLVERIFQTIQEINQQGTTILLVEQNANVALEIATRGYVLETGRIVNSASAEKLRQDPKLREAYLGEM
jgi:ABC-type branched-subunit amino acid transport system ATPase component